MPPDTGPSRLVFLFLTVAVGSFTLGLMVGSTFLGDEPAGDVEAAVPTEPAESSTSTTTSSTTSSTLPTTPSQYVPGEEIAVIEGLAVTTTTTTQAPVSRAPATTRRPAATTTTTQAPAPTGYVTPTTGYVEQ